MKHLIPMLLLAVGTHVTHRYTDSEKAYPFYSTCDYGTVTEYNKIIKHYKVTWHSCVKGMYKNLEGWHKRPSLKVGKKK